MMNCKKHGDYEAKTLKCLGVEITMPCPKCAEEQEAEQIAKELQDKERAENERKTLWIEKASIPKRYRGLLKFTPLEAQKTIHYNYDKNLVIVGGVGSGKTMYACWLGLEAINQHKTVRYIIASDLERKIKDTWGSKVLSEREVTDEYINCDLLILDEIGRTTYNDYIFKVIDGRYNNELPTILLGNIETAEIGKVLGEAIASRLRTNVKVLSFGKEDMRKGF